MTPKIETTESRKTNPEGVP